MLDKFDVIKKRFNEVSELISSPDIVSDRKKFIDLSKEYKELNKIIEKFKTYELTLSNESEALDLIKDESDPEIQDMAKKQLEESRNIIPKLEEELKILLIPKDPDDSKNVVVEIRAGTGGDEASIFAGDLFRMYTKYCLDRGWSTSTVDISEGTAGGFKEIIFEISGEEVYSFLKFESGVHRVQRIPKTETQGRVHTSAATVAVLPEAEEVDIQIKDTDLRIDVFRAGGPGGQSVNTTDSAVRITHIPSGVVVSQQDEKSQHKNKAKALKILRSRVYESEKRKRDQERSSNRRSQIGSGDRSERIRTYNFPQGRVTDHRINLTLHKLEEFLSGEIHEEMNEQLRLKEQNLKLESL